MTTQQDLAPILHEWLEERAGMVRDPFAGFDELLTEAAVTPQRKHSWWPFPLARPRGERDPHRSALMIALSLAVVGLVGGALLVTSLWMSDTALVTQPGMSPAPSASPEPPPGDARRPRTGHTATMLPDGSVLAIGGFSGENFDDRDGKLLRAAERYDPAARRFRKAGSSALAHSEHTATLLDDGRILILGGYANHKRARPAIYDPSIASFTSIPQSWSPQDFAPIPIDHTATRLADGKILVIGGNVHNDLVTSAAILDPQTGRMEATGSLAEARAGHTATLLPDGRVLVIGGIPERGTTHASAEVWDPETRAFSSTGSLREGRYYHTATLLRDGRVLVLGGYAADLNCLIIFGFRLTCGEYEFLRASAEVWDPETSAFSEVGQMVQPRADHTATVRADGRLFIVGGVEASGKADPGERILATSAIFDPADWGLARGSPLNVSP